jgi:hypothetical protein
VSTVVLVAAFIGVAIVSLFAWDSPEAEFWLRLALSGICGLGLILYVIFWHGLKARMGKY